MNDDQLSTLREVGSRPARLTADGRLFIGDDEFPYPILMDSVSVKPLRPGARPHNLLTLTILVGEMTMETKTPRTRSLDT